jgi:hypothetical protein
MKTQPSPQEEELLGIAWACFSALTQICPVLSKPERVLLQHFRFGLSDHAGLQLGALSEGSLLFKDLTEGKEILDHIRDQFS